MSNKYCILYSIVASQRNQKKLQLKFVFKIKAFRINEFKLIQAVAKQTQLFLFMSAAWPRIKSVVFTTTLVDEFVLPTL